MNESIELEKSKKKKSRYSSNEDESSLNKTNKSKAILFENVQFIYELALAQMEMESFNIKYNITNGLREFEIQDSQQNDLIFKRSAYFNSVDNVFTDYYYITQKNTTRSINQYLTHWIYPYKGKFHPQMIRALMNILQLKQGDNIIEPFVGSGTTAIEAMLLGINCTGVDVSPLCVLQSKVKTESIEVVDEIINNKNKFLITIKGSLFNQKNKSFDELLNDIPDEKVKNFYRMAYMVAVSDSVRRGRNFEASFYKNLELMIKSVIDFRDIVNELKLNLGKVNIQQGDARKLPANDESIDGIITSPPYSIALDYVANDAHALSELGYNINTIRENFVGVRGKGNEKIKLYDEDMKKVYNEMYRVLKPQKFVAIVYWKCYLCWRRN